MALTFLLGGARSGKSSLALELVKQSGDAVSFIATGQARDEEMSVRIAAHRLSRPSNWTTIEEPLEIGAVLLAVPEDSALVIDCLTLWVANLIERGDGDGAIADAAALLARKSAQRVAPSVVVSNEVGSGLVPMDALGRRYRDLLGQVNMVFAEQASRALLVVSGQVLSLQSPTEL